MREVDVDGMSMTEGPGRNLMGMGQLLQLAGAVRAGVAWRSACAACSWGPAWEWDWRVDAEDVYVYGGTIRDS